jgi:hypothetical protein
VAAGRYASGWQQRSQGDELSICVENFAIVLASFNRGLLEAANRTNQQAGQLAFHRRRAHRSPPQAPAGILITMPLCMIEVKPRASRSCKAIVTPARRTPRGVDKTHASAALSHSTMLATVY